MLRAHTHTRTAIAGGRLVAGGGLVDLVSQGPQYLGF